MSELIIVAQIQFPIVYHRNKCGILSYGMYLFYKGK